MLDKPEKIVKHCPRHGPAIHVVLRENGCVAKLCIRCYPEFGKGESDGRDVTAHYGSGVCGDYRSPAD